MKKGFTLIELLAVIIILSIIMLIVVPAVRDAVLRSEDKTYELNVSAIKSAAESFLTWNISKYRDEFSTVGYIDVTVDELKTENFLKESVKNPKTNEEFSGYVRITHINDNKYTYEYIEN